MTEVNDSTETTAEGAESGADEYEAALEQFDKGAEQKAEQKSEKTDTALSEEVKFLKAERERIEAERTQQAIDSAAKTIMGELEVDKDLAVGWLEIQARNDPRLMNAWRERQNNPAAFAKVLEGKAKEFQSKFKLDKEATETDEAVRAAVRSASTKAPEKEPLSKADVRKMSKEEFNKLNQELGVRPV